MWTFGGRYEYQDSFIYSIYSLNTRKIWVVRIIVLYKSLFFNSLGDNLNVLTGNSYSLCLIVMILFIVIQRLHIFTSRIFIYICSTPFYYSDCLPNLMLSTIYQYSVPHSDSDWPINYNNLSSFRKQNVSIINILTVH